MNCETEVYGNDLPGMSTWHKMGERVYERRRSRKVTLSVKSWNNFDSKMIFYGLRSSFCRSGESL